MSGPMLSKSELRTAARQKRLTLARADIAAQSARHAEALQLPKGAVVGGYHALPDAASPALPLERREEPGCPFAYPGVAGHGAALGFHRVPDGEVLASCAFGIH